VPDLRGGGRVTIELSGPVIGAAIALAGVLLGLAVNGDRAERQRRRDLHGRALAAVLAYGEMPFMIRRRRDEENERSSERVRLSDHFSGVKAEMSTCEILLAADGDERVSAAYRDLVLTARATVGAEAHEGAVSKSGGNEGAGVASALTCKSKLMEVRPHEEGSPERAVSRRAR
jgi:hypothetical protein